MSNNISLSFGKSKIADSKVSSSALPCHTIVTGNSPPVSAPYYCLGPHLDQAVKHQISKLLKDGIIRPSCSPWASSVVMVPKKTGDWRLCVDYRRLNDVTIRDSCSMPVVEEILDDLSGAKIFSKLDSESGFHQIGVTPKDTPKTAFRCKEGLFEYVKMPFGLKNVPQLSSGLLIMFLEKLFGNLQLFI